MPFVSIQHLELSLQYMFEHTHPALMSVLALARDGAPVSDDPEQTIKYGQATEKRLMAEYFSPSGGSPQRPYYIPFGDAQGKSRWRDDGYAGSSLQRQRKDKRELFRQHPSDRGRWAFAAGAQGWLSVNAVQAIGDIPIVIGYLAAWCYRGIEIYNWASAIERFSTEFQLSELGFVPELFTKDVPKQLAEIAFEESPFDEALLLERLQLSEPSKGVAPEAILVGHSGYVPSLADPKIVKAPVDTTGSWDLGITDLETLEDLQGVLEPARRAVAALQAGMHIIFTGPPGTGKTSLARALLEKADFSYSIVPATDQWTTFDTIGGYFPKPQMDGSERLDFMPGKIVQAIEKGQCLIVDEINRADIDKAFGELFTLLTGNFVSLPYQRRWEPEVGKVAFRNIRLQFGPAKANDDDDVIPVPKWWRLIGSMNDSDKASLKKLSMAFVRRFAFVPVDLPEQTVFENLIRTWAEKTEAAKAGLEQVSSVTETLVTLFADPENGFAKIGMPLGPSFPKSAISYMDSELKIDPTRSADDILLSAFELHIMPQFQGRPDLHEQCRELIGAFVGGEDRIDAHLAVWTGYI
ncbi:AAA family ATPase [Agrobacterium sp. 22-209-1]